MLTHFSLFSGIGGLDLAAEWAGFTTVGQCEIDDYATRVLEKHWPDVPRWRDIYDLRADDIFERTGLEKITALSGGFPCQPHSHSGRRKASLDERDLWPEYRRIIRELRPRWIVAENVRGLLSSENGRFFGGVLRDLAGLGYDAGWCLYKAADVGAFHHRARAFVVSHAHGKRRDELENVKEIGPSDFFTEAFGEEWSRSLDIPMDFAGYVASASGGQERNDDGLPVGVDRLRCIGNAVVPQQAYPVFKAIAEIEMALERSKGNE